MNRIIPLLLKLFLYDKLAHAYLFVGKNRTIETAFWMASRYFCKTPTEQGPCGSCSECKRIESMNHPDIHYIEPDGQSIKIEQIRSLQKEFHYKGVEGDKKCYIIKDVDKMTVQAANSLLKFLEEPNGNSLAILVTENKNRLLDTIISRCQIYQFGEPSFSDIKNDLLREGILEELASLIASLGFEKEEGLSLMEEEWLSNSYKMVKDWLEKITHDPFEALLQAQTKWPLQFDDKKKQQLSLNLLAVFIRDMISYYLNRPILFKSFEGVYQTWKSKFSLDDLLKVIDNVMECGKILKSNTHYILVIELLCHHVISVDKQAV